MRRYLFIDDNETMLGAFERSLSSFEGGAFALCGDVISALAAVQEHEPNLIFLDHELSAGGNVGFEVVRQLQASGFTGTIYSTTSREDLREQYETLGVQYVGKGIRAIGEIRRILSS